MIEFRDVTLRYHYDEYSLFENLSFTLPDGVNTVLCDVQSGKSSLCKMILGLLPPTCGNVLLDGVDLYNGDKGAKPQLSALYLPSQPTFFPNKTVLYNLQYPLRVRKQLAASEEKVALLAEKYNLTDGLAVKVKKLDFRQKKLLSLARGQTLQRDIVLFDSFFDDTEQDDELLSENSVLDSFNCRTKLIFTANPNHARGNTVVIENKKCAYCGDSDGARDFVAGLTWLASLEAQSINQE